MANTRWHHLLQLLTCIYSARPAGFCGYVNLVIMYIAQAPTRASQSSRACRSLTLGPIIMNPASWAAFEHYGLTTMQDTQLDWPEFFTWMDKQFSMEGGPAAVQAEVSWVPGKVSTILVDKGTRRFCVVFAGEPAQAKTAKGAGAHHWIRMKLSTQYMFAKTNGSSLEKYMKDDPSRGNNNFLKAMSVQDVEVIKAHLLAKPRYLQDDVPYYMAHLKRPDVHPVRWDLWL